MSTVAFLRPALAARTETGIGLQRVDHLEEVVTANDTLELEARPLIAGPDDMGFDPADHRQADDKALAATEAMIALHHEALGRDIDNPDVNIAKLAMLANHFVIDRMARGGTQFSYG